MLSEGTQSALCYLLLLHRVRDHYAMVQRRGGTELGDAEGTGGREAEEGDERIWRPGGQWGAVRSALGEFVHGSEEQYGK